MTSAYTKQSILVLPYEFNLAEHRELLPQESTYRIKKELVSNFSRNTNQPPKFSSEILNYENTARPWSKTRRNTQIHNKS